MNKNILITVATTLALLFFVDCFMFPQIKFPDKTKFKNKNEGFAVVELFTSEGCSSCPPADELLANIQNETKGKNVYVLAFHVDYWNRLGWKDRFSKEEFTDRQRQYQKWLGLNVMYTPQFVINGTSEFAGDSKLTLYKQVSKALNNIAESNLHLDAKTTGNSLKVHYKTDRISENSSLFLAIVTKKASTKVERGENTGVLLNHVQIVSSSYTFTLKGKEDVVEILKPSSVNSKDYELIGFVQNNETGAIISATRINL
ncbi:DUF1223 domain-containing protein [Flavobacterium lindanitolerans]|uniref:Uncharacterized protein DUF1223 n=1 Tax=Flavobacterium lindanitolerans TaxID=428988 RepID=A0A497UDL0_9FLAO|nr:DUF1223 domain-containing protein [Flavobacterium lindanitolerans]PKW30326.1 uncharacterized protein DUF1223 [Flavobacterium lindanitolerans]RLJ24664.1 uncharacterized protein DUF1223 [Flavobacterium lindanitolerans]